MAGSIILSAREPDAVARQPENIRRAEHMTARGPYSNSHSGAFMGNLRPVAASVEVRVLADFFTHGQVANHSAVDSATLRDAVERRTPVVPAQSGDREG